MLRRVGKPVKVANVLWAVIVDGEAVAIFPLGSEAERWKAGNYKGRADVTVEAVTFDDTKGAG